MARLTFWTVLCCCSTTWASFLPEGACDATAGGCSSDLFSTLQLARHGAQPQAIVGPYALREDGFYAFQPQAVVGPYALGEEWSNTCPSGASRLNEQECRQAASMNQGHFQGAIHLEYRPAGCFMRLHYGKGPDRYFFNSHSIGRGNDRRVTVCSEPQALSDGVYTIQQKVNNRYLDAWENSGHDYAATTRTHQDNDSQKWLIKFVGGNLYTIQQKANNRYLDAWEDSDHDYAATTRTHQDNDSQKWLIKFVGGNLYTIQQKVNNRYLDAWEDSDHDYAATTRTHQDNDSQKWLIKSV